MNRLTFLLISISLSVIRTACSQDTIVLQPGPEGKDAMFDNILPDQNWGNTPKFTCMAWTNSGNPGANRGLIDFDLSVIPPYAEILDAKLSLYFVCLEPTYIPHTGENESYLQLITSEWDEGMVTWNTQPSTTTDDQVYLPRSTEPEQDYPDINVTLPIRKMYNEPGHFHGLMLRLKNEEPYKCLLFAGCDYMDDPGIRPKLVIVYKPCNPPAPLFTFSVDEQTVNFSGISSTADSWSWDFGDGYSSSLQNPVHEYQEQGYYEVCLAVEDSCGTGQYCETLQLCKMPSAGFGYLSDGLTVNFQDTSRFSDNYFWTFGDGYYSDLPQPWHTYDTAGYFEVCLETRNVCGADTVCQVIFVDYSSIDEHEGSSFSLFPNPASDQVFIKAELAGPVTLSLHDLSGKDVMRRELVIKDDQIIPLTLDHINPGIYIVRLDSGNKQAFGKLVIVK